MAAFGGQPVGDGPANTLRSTGDDGARTGQPLCDGSRLPCGVIVCICHETTAPAGGLPRVLPKRPSRGTAAVRTGLRGVQRLKSPATAQRLPVVLGPAT